MIKVLFEGLHDCRHFDGYYEIDPLTSSSTLIKKDGVNVLVDTGAEKYGPLLLEKLHEEGLSPSDVHLICNTHYHMDHCANDVFFKNAEVLIGRSKLDYKTGKATIYHNPDLISLPCGIKLLLTPGHTADHASYIFEENGVRYVCAGDAVREETIRRQKIPKIHLPDEFMSSMKIIFESADVIIPGHGGIIQGELKKELYELVNGKWE